MQPQSTDQWRKAQRSTPKNQLLPDEEWETMNSVYRGGNCLDDDVRNNLHSCRLFRGLTRGEPGRICNTTSRGRGGANCLYYDECSQLGDGWKSVTWVVVGRAGWEWLFKSMCRVATVAVDKYIEVLNAELSTTNQLAFHRQLWCTKRSINND